MDTGAQQGVPSTADTSKRAPPFEVGASIVPALAPVVDGGAFVGSVGPSAVASAVFAAVGQGTSDALQLSESRDEKRCSCSVLGGNGRDGNRRGPARDSAH